MSAEPQLQSRPKPLPPKKRYSVLLPQELAERFERVAGLRHGSKSAIVEEALDRRLNPEKYPLIGDALLRRLDEQSRSIATLKRDTVIVAEMLSLFVRYFLTITPPLGEREQQPARALGKERFQVFVAQIGRRLASDRRLVSEVLKSIATHSPDLLVTIGEDVPLKVRPAPAGDSAPAIREPTAIPLRRRSPMPELSLVATPAAQQAKDRRRQMLRTAFGPTIAAALADPTVLEVMVNPDGRLWIDRATSGRADSGQRMGAAETERIIRLVAAHVRREVTDKAPIVSASPRYGRALRGCHAAGCTGAVLRHPEAG